jgi:hypothetical protein
MPVLRIAGTDTIAVGGPLMASSDRAGGTTGWCAVSRRGAGGRKGMSALLW